MKRKIRTAILATIAATLFAVSAHACNCPNKTSAGDGKDVPKISDPIAEKILIPYLSIRAALADDTTAGIARDAAAISEVIAKNTKKTAAGKPATEYSASIKKILSNAGALKDKGSDIEAARKTFGSLSEAVVEYFKANVSTADAEKYQAFYCSMAKKPWLQKAGEKIGNPYYGKSMSDCGEKISVAPDKPCAKCDKCKCDKDKSQGKHVH